MDDGGREPSLFDEAQEVGDDVLHEDDSCDEVSRSRFFAREAAMNERVAILDYVVREANLCAEDETHPSAYVRQPGSFRGVCAAHAGASAQNFPAAVPNAFFPRARGFRFVK